MSSFASGKTEEWVFRIFGNRTIAVKAKNAEVKKIAVIDVKTNLAFTLETEDASLFEELQSNQSYYASINVLTARNVNGLPPEAMDFFKVLDVDQPIEDFIKAYWLYPKLIRFVLTDAEPI